MRFPQSQSFGLSLSIPLNGFVNEEYARLIGKLIVDFQFH